MNACATASTSESIPARAGIGLRAPHYQELIDSRPDVAWLEVHSENYFGGGAPLHFLERAREHYPLSLHGVGLSLGSADALHRPHLQRLKQLIARVEPGFVSDHLSWSSIDGRYLNDLLPLPYTEEALDHIVGRINEVQDYLGRQLLLENPSTYLQYSHSTLPEWEFLAAAAQRSGCGILLDVNNIYVSARNHGFDPLLYLHGIPPLVVQELHLAGHLVREVDGREILIDTHNARVCEAVWALYRATLAHLGPRPTLIEWDTDLPTLEVLVEEAHLAAAQLEPPHAAVAA